jgi:hypothetical protein
MEVKEKSMFLIDMRDGGFVGLQRDGGEWTSLRILCSAYVKKREKLGIK